MSKSKINNKHINDCCTEFAKDHFRKELKSNSEKKAKRYSTENMYHIGKEFFEEQHKKSSS